VLSNLLTGAAAPELVTTTRNSVKVLETDMFGCSERVEVSMVTKIQWGGGSRSSGLLRHVGM
jgi:hypothetical protein